MLAHADNSLEDGPTFATFEAENLAAELDDSQEVNIYKYMLIVFVDPFCSDIFMYFIPFHFGILLGLYFSVLGYFLYWLISDTPRCLGC